MANSLTFTRITMRNRIETRVATAVVVVLGLTQGRGQDD
jgi:hypothetical protein